MSRYGVVHQRVSALDLDALEPVLSGEAPVMVHARHPVDIRAALRVARAA